MLFCVRCRLLQHGERKGAFLLIRSAEQQRDITADIAEQALHLTHLCSPRNPFADSVDLGLKRIDRQDGERSLGNSERDDEAE